MSGPRTMPAGGVRELLATGFVTEPTRAALQAKLDRLYAAPRFFERGLYATLQTLCDRLIPQPVRVVDIAGALDERLAEGERNGWRYDALPPDAEAFRRGLAGVEETARAMCGAPFAALLAEQQNAVIGAIQGGQPLGAIWAGLPAARWFEEVLVEATEIYFAHPLAQERIGYVGMADAGGWTAIGLNEDEPTVAGGLDAAA